MSIATDRAEKHARILGEFADFGLNLVRKLHDQARAAETSEETASLAKAFHSVSRSVRQTLALEAYASSTRSPGFTSASAENPKSVTAEASPLSSTHI